MAADLNSARHQITLSGIWSSHIQTPRRSLVDRRACPALVDTVTLIIPHDPQLRLRAFALRMPNSSKLMAGESNNSIEHTIEETLKDGQAPATPAWVESSIMVKLNAKLYMF
jgi:hypothetical protein